MCPYYRSKKNYSLLPKEGTSFSTGLGTDCLLDKLLPLHPPTLGGRSEIVLNNPSSLSRSSEDFCSRPFTSFIALLWTRSSTSMMQVTVAQIKRNSAIFSETVSLAEKDLRVLLDTKLNKSQQCALAAKGD
ncbi:hypothetical protein QYF61_006246 [Mycteria americana]|uniref:Uncharacterized protein n=1 Tax=Mycteria americana TaxID=33587 RepID=A0AAN7N563_MYCAM|nr:hypothetical protein QYF61_006246 [Mycteria americana]